MEPYAAAVVTPPPVPTHTKPEEVLAGGDRSHQRTAVLVLLCLFLILLFPAE